MCSGHFFSTNRVRFYSEFPMIFKVIIIFFNVVGSRDADRELVYTKLAVADRIHTVSQKGSPTLLIVT